MGSLRAFLAVPAEAGPCPDGSGDEVDGGDGNNTETSRVPIPRCLCAFVYLWKNVHTTESGEGKEGPFSNRNTLFISGT